MELDVIMSTKNSEKVLEMCLNSIFEEIPVHKLIVVDGDSTDKTLEILKKFPKAEVHVKPELSLGASREFAIKKVTTDWFCVIDSDVVLRGGWFKEHWEYTKKYDVVEGSIVNHYDIEFDNKKDKRGFLFCDILKTETCKDISIPNEVTFYEDYVVKKHIEKKGHTWFKASEFLADHYPDINRYKQAKLKIAVENLGRDHWIKVGYIEGKYNLVPIWKSLFYTLKFPLTTFTSEFSKRLLRFYGFIKGRLAGVR